MAWHGMAWRMAGRVSAFVGSGRQAPVDGTGTAASFDYPTGLALDGRMHVWVVDYNKHTLRKISPQGVVTTVAGDNKAGCADGQGSAALFNGPNAVAVAEDGRVFVADVNNYRVRVVTPDGTATALMTSVMTCVVWFVVV
jgi:hypothetical protein